MQRLLGFHGGAAENLVGLYLGFLSLHKIALAMQRLLSFHGGAAENLVGLCPGFLSLHKIALAMQRPLSEMVPLHETARASLLSPWVSLTALAMQRLLCFEGGAATN